VFRLSVWRVRNYCAAIGVVFVTITMEVKEPESRSAGDIPIGRPACFTSVTSCDYWKGALRHRYHLFAVST